MNHDALRKEIGYELQQLTRTAELAGRLYREAEGNPKPWHCAAAAKYISDVMLGLENLWRRRCRHLQYPPPAGPSSHRQTLTAFLDDKDLGGQFPAEFAERLGLYLRFRHRFIHGYGFELDWEMVKEPLALLPETVRKLVACWENWLAGIVRNSK